MFKIEGTEFNPVTIQRFKSLDEWLKWASPRFYPAHKDVRRKEMLSLAYEKVNGKPTPPPQPVKEDKK